VREWAERVARFWRDSNADPRPGADSTALADFRLHNDATIPDELAEFYRVTNGIESDANLFAVWSLGAVRRVPEALGDFRGSPDYGEIAQDLPDAEAYLAFADYMIWSHVFAVRAFAGDVALGPVVWICGAEHGIVAPTFAAFWDHYLADPLGTVVI
jgi:hypothetical protein